MPCPYCSFTPGGTGSVQAVYRQCTGTIQPMQRQYTISSNGRFRIVGFLIAGVRRRAFPDASHLTFAYFQRFPGIQFGQQASSVLLTVNKLQPLNCINFQMQRYIKLLKYTCFFVLTAQSGCFLLQNIQYDGFLLLLRLCVDRSALTTRQGIHCSTYPPRPKPPITMLFPQKE